MDASTRFTKWRCVRGKNPQKIHLYVMIQNLPLISKMGIAALLIQRPTNGGHFSFFFKIYLVFFCLFLQIVASFIKSPNLKSEDFVFIICDDFVFIVSLTGYCGARLTQNEKWRPFGGRWIKKTKTNIVEFSEKSWIRQAASSFWGFLCRTKVFFMNRVLQWHRRAAFLPCSSRIYGSFLFREKFATTKC